MNLSKLLQVGGREITEHIWEYNSKLIVTNGVVMINIKPDLVEDCKIKPLPIKYHATTSNIINYPYKDNKSFAAIVDLQDFKQFLGEPEYSKKCDCEDKERVKCTECYGKGIRICNLGEEHECLKCIEDYRDKCFDGWIKPKPRYIGFDDDVVVNGNALAQYLVELHGDAVVSCNGDKPVKFAGKGWEIFISPVRNAVQEVRKYDKKI